MDHLRQSLGATQLQRRLQLLEELMAQVRMQDRKALKQRAGTVDVMRLGGARAPRRLPGTSLEGHPPPQRHCAQGCRGCGPDVCTPSGVEHVRTTQKCLFSQRRMGRVTDGG